MQQSRSMSCLRWKFVGKPTRLLVHNTPFGIIKLRCSSRQQRHDHLDAAQCNDVIHTVLCARRLCHLTTSGDEGMRTCFCHLRDSAKRLLYCRFIDIQIRRGSFQHAQVVRNLWKRCRSHRFKTQTRRRLAGCRSASQTSCHAPSCAGRHDHARAWCSLRLCLQQSRPPMIQPAFVSLVARCQGHQPFVHARPTASPLQQSSRVAELVCLPAAGLHCNSGKRKRRSRSAYSYSCRTV